MRIIALSHALLVSALVCIGCGGSQSAPAPTPIAADGPAPEATPPTKATPVAPAPTTPSCDAAPAGAASDAFAKAVALDEAVKRGERDKHDTYVERQRLYNEAAEGGHLEGQYKAGWLAFGTMFTMEAPKPEHKADYVRALTYLFVAGLRGHASARTYVPDMPAILDTRAIPATLQTPLDSIPRAWLDEALAAAQKDPCVVAAAKN